MRSAYLLALALAGCAHAGSRATDASIVSGSEGRDYRLYVPASYDAAHPTALVLSFHGAAGTPAHQMRTTRWNEWADAHGFIVAYPAGTGRPRIWRAMPGTDVAADVRFVSDLLDTLAAHYNIDPTRIYADGLSNGGGMVFALSCAMPDRIAAVGLVAAARTLSWDSCADMRPVPMIAFHGRQDRVVPFAGGTSWSSPAPFPDVREWTAGWASRNRCRPDPVVERSVDGVTRIEYRGCAEGAPVLLYVIEEGGHSWPGGEPLPEWLVGRTSNAIDATGETWEFFEAHPLRR